MLLPSFFCFTGWTEYPFRNRIEATVTRSAYKACSGISYIDIQLYASADASDEKPSKYPDRSKNITARQRAYTKEEMIEVEIDG